MDIQSIKACEAELFREAFEGRLPGNSGTWFVEKTEAIFDAIQSLDAEDASRLVPGQSATIGAHVWHLHHYLWLFNAEHQGESPKPDWEGSWKTQRFTEEEWVDVATRLKLDYEEAVGWYAEASNLDKDHWTHSIANIAHAAYHLGAIRSLMPIVKHSA